MKNLLWLASYPKSGNTWMRVFLANLQKEGNEPVSINIIGDQMACSRNLFNQFSGLESTLLTDVETLNFRHKMYQFMNNAQEKLTFLKTHSHYLSHQNGEKLFPASISHGAIYLLRSPLDLAASLANHNASTIDASISLMSDESYTLFANANGNIQSQLREPISSWNQHVTSWTKEYELPILIIRYEDMVFQPLETFSRAAHFAGLSESPEQIQKAIQNSSFDVLQKQEQTQGFREKPHKTLPFFRKGKVGSWREELSPAQAAQIIENHGDVMRKFGYLTESGEPVY